VSARLAPSLVRFRDEVDRIWPDRDRKSDGWLGDAAHQSGVTDLDHDGDVDANDAALKSQHNPDAAGIVHAVDIDRDGVDPDKIVAAVRAHPAAWYVIWNRRIYSRKNGWAPKAYTGADPHTGHLHVSIRLAADAVSDSRPWFPEDTMPLTTSDLQNVRAQVQAEIAETVPGIVLDVLQRFAVAAGPAYQRDIGDGAKSVPLRMWEKAAAHAFATRVAVTKLAGEIADDPQETATEVARLVVDAVGQLPAPQLEALAIAVNDERDKRERERLGQA
jgi:hypothetical protein